ncbi:MAG: DUF882 domain-containing protein [Devosia sp.]
MSGNIRGDWHWGLRALLAGVALLLFVANSSLPVRAAFGDRTLYLHHTHTGETGKFTFRRNGVYDQTVLRQLNIFLADWRTKEPTKMDPALFDLIWTIYQEVGASQPVNIVSSYRSPKTNAMLRAKSSGVAENSQHIRGNAMDIFIPGIELSKLRATAMRHQVGGVGYYPTSGSPFVHVDTGSVRAWPRMTTAQLKKVFPDGRTLHLPVDGKPLSSDGRAYAQAQWNKCHMVPCSGSPIVSVPDTVEVLTASLDPAQRSVSTVDIHSVIPAPRPDFGIASVPFPARKSPEMELATRAQSPIETDAFDAFDLLQEPAGDRPEPRVLMTPEDTEVLTAYAPDIVPDEGAQRALQILIERETTASATAKKPIPPLTVPEPELPLIAPDLPVLEPQPTVRGGTQVAALDPSEIRPGLTGGTNGLDIVATMFDLTWTAVTEAGSRPDLKGALEGRNDIPVIKGLLPRRFDLVAPEVDHVDETLATPEMISSAHYSELYEPEGYLDGQADLGPYASRMIVESNLVAPEAYDRFIRRAPQLSAE